MASKLDLQPFDIMALISSQADGVVQHIKNPGPNGIDPEGILRQLSRAFSFAEALKEIADRARAEQAPSAEAAEVNGAAN